MILASAESSRSRAKTTVGIMIYLKEGKQYFFPSPTTVIQGQPVPAYMGGLLAESTLGRELIELPSTKIEYGSTDEKRVFTCLKVLKSPPPVEESIPVVPKEVKEPTPDDYAAVAVVGKED